METASQASEQLETVEVDLEGLDLTPEEVGLGSEPTEVDDDGGAEIEAGSEPAGSEPVETETPPATETSTVDALRAELTQLRREYDDLRQGVEPLTRRPQVDVNGQRLQHLHDKIRNAPGTVTGAEYLEYHDLRDQRRMAQLQADAYRHATVASSEAHARGIFTEKEMGKGRGFDDLMQKHMRPLYQKAPSLQVLRQLVPEQPAYADYLWASVAEVLESCNYDVPVACRKVLGALDAPVKAAKEIGDRVRRVEASNAAKIHGADTTVGAGSKKKIENFWDMPDKDFDAIARRNELMGG